MHHGSAVTPIPSSRPGPVEGQQAARHRPPPLVPGGRRPPPPPPGRRACGPARSESAGRDSDRAGWTVLVARACGQAGPAGDDAGATRAAADRQRSMHAASAAFDSCDAPFAPTGRSRPWSRSTGPESRPGRTICIHASASAVLAKLRCGQVHARQAVAATLHRHQPGRARDQRHESVQRLQRHPCAAAAAEVVEGAVAEARVGVGSALGGGSGGREGVQGDEEGSAEVGEEVGVEGGAEAAAAVDVGEVSLACGGDLVVVGAGVEEEQAARDEREDLAVDGTVRK